MSDKPDVAALIARLRRMREHGGQDYACMDDAAAALQSQAEKVAELEQQRMAASSLWAQNATRADTAEARVQELEDAVRGWEACLVRANEERDIFKAERDALRADAVPREPTEKMLRAAHRIDDMSSEAFECIWTAMYDAARAKVPPLQINEQSK